MRTVGSFLSSSTLTVLPAASEISTNGFGEVVFASIAMRSASSFLEASTKVGSPARAVMSVFTSKP